ncbi:hypothetical protein INR49_016507 [Caranx melampygus]|nr:hypothetical protein INR49_016507 [Caranx melampygus]
MQTPEPSLACSLLHRNTQSLRQDQVQPPSSKSSFQSHIISLGDSRQSSMECVVKLLTVADAKVCFLRDFQTDIVWRLRVVLSMGQTLLKQQHCTVPIAALYKALLFSIHSLGLFPLIWKMKLWNKYKVTSIPSLVFVDATTGKVVCRNGLLVVRDDPKVFLYEAN